jgi:peptidoglycan/LPS O-acetylase OafA/YrhL
MDLLAVGGFLCIEWRERREIVAKWGARVGLPLCILGVFLLLLLGHYGYSTYGNSRVGNVLIYEACLLICLGIMLYALGGKLVNWLESPPLTFIGKISYTMYLVHPAFLSIALTRVQGVRLTAVTFALTVGYATLSWYGMERFLLSRGKPASGDKGSPLSARKPATTPFRTEAEEQAPLGKIEQVTAAQELP